MRIYEGSPRQDWEEVLRSVGAYLDDRGMRGLVFLETDTGFIIQGTTVEAAAGSQNSDSMGKAMQETVILQDDDVSRFMDEALAGRGQEPDPTPRNFESQLRVIGRYLDEQHPRDIFFFELDGSYVIRLTMAGPGGLKQELVEFTRDDIADLIARAPALRRGSKAKDSPA
ncbi:MAG: hypothetical protein ACREBE_28145 [bacterium]